MVSQSSAAELSRAANGTTRGPRQVVVAIHQPNYLPWLGYFYKMSRADKFVFLDVVAAPKGGFVNRNSIKTRDGPAWLTVPILTAGRFGQPISEIETDNVDSWPHRHLMTLYKNYCKAPHFRDIFCLLQPIYERVTGTRSLLADFNIHLIRAIAYFLGLDPQWQRASELQCCGQKTDLVVSVCINTGATVYISGTGARVYQDEAAFAEAGITAVYSDFVQQSYPQRFGNFVPNLSIVDVLMNCGYEGTRRLLNLETTTL